MAKQKKINYESRALGYGLVPFFQEIHWARFGKSESTQFLFYTAKVYMTRLLRFCFLLAWHAL